MNAIKRHFPIGPGPSICGQGSFTGKQAFLQRASMEAFIVHAATVVGSSFSNERCGLRSVLLWLRVAIDDIDLYSIAGTSIVGERI